MERVRDAILPPGSLEWRLDRLPDDLKKMHQSWRERCDVINHATEKNGNRYELLLAGDDNMPPMPTAVYQALWPQGNRHEITTDMSVSMAAEAYTLLLEQGSKQ